MIEGRNFILNTGESSIYAQLMCAEAVDIDAQNEVGRRAGVGRYDGSRNGALFYTLKVAAAQVLSANSVNTHFAKIVSGSALQWWAEDVATGFVISGTVLPETLVIKAAADSIGKYDITAQGDGMLYAIAGTDDRGHLVYEDYGKVLLTDNAKILVNG